MCLEYLLFYHCPYTQILRHEAECQPNEKNEEGKLSIFLKKLYHSQQLNESIPKIHSIIIDLLKSNATWDHHGMPFN
jgi:hypothetical protein